MYFEHQNFLWFSFFALIPIFILIGELKNIKKVSSFLYKSKSSTEEKQKKLRNRLIHKNVCFALAVICICFALANPYWGTKTVPVQKNGNSAALVFDISWSMLADDNNSQTDISSYNADINVNDDVSADVYISADNDINVSDDLSVTQKHIGDGVRESKNCRLQLAKDFAHDLILSKNTEGQLTAYSLIATKGNAVQLVSQTQDYNALLTAIDALWPGMISSSGTNLADGIEKALYSFSETQATQNSIIIFTDGEETDGSLERALNMAANKSLNIFVIGFGKTQGSDIIIEETADKKTRVHTALKEESLKSMVERIKEKEIYSKNKIEYFNFADKNCKKTLISVLNENATNDEDSKQLGFEIKNVSHRNLFIILALFLISVGIFLGHFKFAKGATSIMLVMLLFSSCSVKPQDSFSVLRGAFLWHEGNYNKAEVEFLQTLDQAELENNDYVSQYAILGLATSYAMQNEKEAALSRFMQIKDDAPSSVKFTAFYNIGIISFSQGNYTQAKENFKKALQLNPKSIDAKINFELAEKQIQKEKNAKNQKAATNNSVLKDSIFSVMKENDQNLWKNQQKEQSPKNSLDY